MYLIALAFVMLLVSSSANATWKPEYAQLDQGQRQWYRDQKNPSTKVPCCSETDGINAQEDIRGDAYWVRFDARGIDSGWMEAPASAIIHSPNRHGAPIVWFYFDNGRQTIENLRIRCFVPGAKL